MFPVARIRSDRASVSVRPSPPFDADAILRRFSTPSPYTGLNHATGQSAAQPTEGPSSQEHGIVPPSKILDYAVVVVASRAHNVLDPPLLYFGDELNGAILLPRDNLSDMRSMEVVFQLFESDPISPSYENKHILLPQQVDESCISGGQFSWPFVFTPPPVLSSSSSSTAGSSRGDSSLGHLSPSGHRIRPKVQLIVTIYRRGRLTPNIGLRQPIHYEPLPDPVITSSPSLLSTELPSSNSGESPGLTVDSAWPQQKCPKVVVRGVIFHQLQVSVECKVSHPVSDVIPLRLIMTSQSHQALELLAVSHAIDVRLLKALVFGNAANIHPFTLRNRSSYHRTDWAAKAHWEAGSRAWEVPSSDEHPQVRWRIKLNGTLHREPNVEITESFEQRGTALMYFVCLFPFRSADFRPASDPNKELFMAKLPITRQR
ncbi:hypothetical protein EDB86DRAFT_2895576 [Lactarius hatsudake]|nr:hypothetical protein EDB86DRAFT_2895576 [Lactarius hatsudake]